MNLLRGNFSQTGRNSSVAGKWKGRERRKKNVKPVRCFFHLRRLVTLLERGINFVPFFFLLLSLSPPVFVLPLSLNSNKVVIIRTFFFLNCHKTFHNVIRCRRTKRRYYNSTNYEFTISEIIPPCRCTKLWQERTRLEIEKKGGEGIKCLAWNFVGARFSFASVGIWVTQYGKSREDSRWRLSPKFCRSFPLKKRERKRKEGEELKWKGCEPYIAMWKKILSSEAQNAW